MTFKKFIERVFSRKLAKYNPEKTQRKKSLFLKFKLEEIHIFGNFLVNLEKNTYKLISLVIITFASRILIF